MEWGSVKQDFFEMGVGRGSVNIEPTICNGHLSYT